MSFIPGVPPPVAYFGRKSWDPLGADWQQKVASEVQRKRQAISDRWLSESKREFTYFRQAPPGLLFPGYSAAGAYSFEQETQRVANDQRPLESSFTPMGAPINQGKSDVLFGGNPFDPPGVRRPMAVGVGSAPGPAVPRSCETYDSRSSGFAGKGGYLPYTPEEWNSHHQVLDSLPSPSLQQPSIIQDDANGLHYKPSSSSLTEDVSKSVRFTSTGSSGALIVDETKSNLTVGGLPAPVSPSRQKESASASSNAKTSKSVSIVENVKKAPSSAAQEKKKEAKALSKPNLSVSSRIQRDYEKSLKEARKLKKKRIKQQKKKLKGKKVLHNYGTGNVHPLTDETFMKTFNSNPPPEEQMPNVLTRRELAHSYEGWKDALALIPIRPSSSNDDADSMSMMSEDSSVSDVGIRRSSSLTSLDTRIDRSSRSGSDSSKGTQSLIKSKGDPTRTKDESKSDPNTQLMQSREQPARTSNGSGAVLARCETQKSDDKIASSLSAGRMLQREAELNRSRSTERQRPLSCPQQTLPEQQSTGALMPRSQYDDRENQLTHPEPRQAWSEQYNNQHPGLTTQTYAHVGYSENSSQQTYEPHRYASAESDPQGYSAMWIAAGNFTPHDITACNPKAYKFLPPTYCAFIPAAGKRNQRSEPVAKLLDLFD